MSYPFPKRKKISTIGEGWNRISIDDPQRDKRTIINNTMRELCHRTNNAKRNGESVEFTIDEIINKPLGAYTNTSNGKQYVIDVLKEYEQEKEYIKLYNGRVKLTRAGIESCYIYI
jgi:hypothetical protein